MGASVILTLALAAGCARKDNPLYIDESALDVDFGSTEIKRVVFGWDQIEGADDYVISWKSVELESGESTDEPVSQVATIVPLHLHAGDPSYTLRGCNSGGCRVVAIADASETLRDGVGYFKAGTSIEGDTFGAGLALSADGQTIAVGTPGKSIDASDGGVVYMYIRDAAASASDWVASSVVLSPSIPVDGGNFGCSVALSADGHTLVVGACGTDTVPGAVYSFVRSGGTDWTPDIPLGVSQAPGYGTSVALSADGQIAAVGAPNGGAVHIYADNGSAWIEDGELSGSTGFGYDVALSGEGDTLVVGAPLDDGTGAAHVFTRDDGGEWSPGLALDIAGAAGRVGESVALAADGQTLAVGASEAGKVHVFARAGNDWSSVATLVAPNANTNVAWQFGAELTLSASGDMLVVGAPGEAGAGLTGQAGAPLDAARAGAAYVFVREGNSWVSSAYVKAPNTEAGDEFGARVMLSGDGQSLVVAAPKEDGGGNDIGPLQTDNSKADAGAVYLF